MVTTHRNVDQIKELIASNRLSMIDGSIVFDGKKRKITSHSGVTIPISRGEPIYPNCYMLAYIIQGGGDIAVNQKVVPIEGTSLLIGNLKLVPGGQVKKPRIKNQNPKLPVSVMAAIRREYRNRFIVPCSFTTLKKKYQIDNTLIVTILYNTSTVGVWAELAVIEPPLNRADSRNYVRVPLGGRKKLTPEHKEKLRKASLAWHASHPRIKPYSNQNRPVKIKPKVVAKPIVSNYELLKAALEKEIKTSKFARKSSPPSRRSIFSNDDRFTDTFSEEEFDPAEVLDNSILDKTE